MDFQQTKRSYYADFIVTPTIIITLALLASTGDVAAAGLAVLAGIFVWTFAEYWIHRVLFHRVFKEAHRLHHIRPRGFDAAPWWTTALVQLALAGACTAALGLDVGGGLVIGLEAGYYAYIYIHDRIHHGGKATGGRMKRLARAHAIHHRGKEVNFGVVTTLWDRAFRTYDPR